MSKKQQIHQWTDDQGYVLLVKCLNRDGTAFNGFIWPKSGPVEPEVWSRAPDCDSGGLFGWPWGLLVGDGRFPDACAPWLVFRAKPENVIDIGGSKAKAIPGENGDLPEVVYYGTQAGAIEFTRIGRMAWIEYRAGTKRNASGDGGSASASGSRGSASASGYGGSASASGDGAIATCTGSDSRIEIGPCALGAATGRRLTWLVRPGAVLAVRWQDYDDAWQSRLFDSAQMDVNDGDCLIIDQGEVARHIPAPKPQENPND